MPPEKATALLFSGPGKPLRAAHLPLPSRLAAGEVLVQIHLATLCGSDLHTLAGRRPAPLPCVLGHEAIGRVAASARPGLKEGARLTWSIADSCGTCPPCREHHLPEKCRSLFKYGHAALDEGSGLNGCYATHILLRPGTHIVEVGEDLPDAVLAPANCALATMVNATALLPIPCRTALVQGAGLLGLYGCALLRERGVEHLFCVDVDERRLERVHLFGATPVIGRPDRYIGERARIEALAPQGVDAVFEVAGSSDLVPEGIRLLRPGGFYAFVGMVHPGTPLQITGEEIVRKCLTVRGVHNYSPRHLDAAIAFLAETADRYPYASLVGPPYPLSRLPEAVQAAQRREHFRESVQPQERL